MPPRDRLSRLARQRALHATPWPAMVVLGVVTQSLWDALEDRALLHQVAYGLPALQDGRWWTPVSGAFFALVPAQYLPVAGGALLLVGWAELRLGTPSRGDRRRRLRTWSGCSARRCCCCCCRGTGWDWADRTGRRPRRRLQRRCPRGRRGGERHPAAAVARPAACRARAVRRARPALRRAALGPRAPDRRSWVGLALGPVLVGRRPHGAALRASPGTSGGSSPRRSSSSPPLCGSCSTSRRPTVRSGRRPTDSDASGVLVGAAISLAAGRRAAQGVPTGVAAGRGPHRAVLRGPRHLLVVVEVVAPDQLERGGDVVSSCRSSSSTRCSRCSSSPCSSLGRSAFQARSTRRRRRRAAHRGRATATRRSALLKDARRVDDVVDGHVARQPLVHPPRRPAVPVGYVAFQVHRGIAIALGDPVGGRRRDAALPCSRLRRRRRRRTGSRCASSR